MGGVSVEYTTDPSADVAAALIREGNSDGHEGVNWKTGTVTSSATALRFVTEQEIDPGFAGSATITVSVDGLGVGGVLKNDFYGKTTEVNGDPNTVKTIVGAAELTLRSSAASLAGTVYRDNDFSGTVSDADTTWASGSQTLTISNEFGSFTTDIAANGTYDFGIIPGGDYAATLTDGQGWALVLPNPISIAIGDIRVAENLLFQEAVAVPTAVADTASTSAGQSVTVNVKKNDTWPNATAPAAQTAAVIAVGGEATYGTATLTTDGTLSYTASTVWPTEHDGAESYQDTITYVVTNAAGGTASATVTVTVYPSPVAANDSATVRDGKPTTLNVLSNDAGNSIAIVPGSVATAGDATASIVDGTVSVIPTHTWAVGEKTYETAIDYTIEDAFGQRSSATVTVTVQRAPVVTGQSNLTIASDGTATFSPAVLNPDVLEAGGVAVASKPKGSTVVVGDDGSITFVPGTAGVGEHTFTVDYTDNLGQTTTHTFTVTVYEALAGVADEATVRSDTASTLNVLVNDRGDALQLVDAGSSWTIDPATAANAGSVTIVNGSLEYTPFGTYQWAESELSYAETLSYVVEDAHGKRETVTVVVTVIRPPSGVDRHLTVEPEFEKVIFDPIGEATGTGIVPLADSDIVADPAHGVVEILGGVVHYVPTPGFVGDDTFVVRMTDVVGQTTEVRYTVTVLAADAPAPTAPGTGGESAKPQPGGPVTENPSDRLTDPETSGSRDAGARGLAVTGTGATSGWTVTALAFAMMLGLSLVAQQRLRRAEADRVS
nr:Ig-like domain-containing protein [Lysinibacter cavernae]